MLIIVMLVVGVALATTHSDAFANGSFWGQTAFAAMYAGALALSLRTATPNLAVSTIGAASGWWYVHLVGDGTASLVAWLAVLAAALGIGLLLAALVGLAPLPGWAVSLVATGILAGGLLASDTSTVPLSGGSAYPGNGVFAAWTVLLLVGSVVVALLLASPSIRAAVSQHRQVAGAPPARLPGRLLGALVGLGGSSLLAGVGGILFVQRAGAAQPFDSVGMGFALAAVLLGGVSLLGGRGGITGVAVAVLLVAFVQLWMSLDGAGTGVQHLVLGVLAALGLGVNALMEWLGNRLERDQAGPAPQQPPEFG